MAKCADLIGVPFEYGGRGPDAFDCYGLLMEMYRRDGIILPDYRSPDQLNRIAALMAMQLDLWRETEKRPGAAVLIRIGRFNSHVGYVLDGMRFVHTWEESGGVVTERLSSWESKIAGYYEFAGHHQ